MTAGRKIAAATVQNRTQTPFWDWLRNKLLAVDRQKITPPPGLGEGGKCGYSNPLRFPNTQAARPGSAELPTLPGGVHHKIEDNYYLGRDGRRTVLPPSALYKADKSGVAYATSTGEELKREDAIFVNKGPDMNFGLQAPTPGFGAQWVRNKTNERDAQKNASELAFLERFDKFSASK